MRGDGADARAQGHAANGTSDIDASDTPAASRLLALSCLACTLLYELRMLRCDAGSRSLYELLFIFFFISFLFTTVSIMGDRPIQCLTRKLYKYSVRCNFF